MASKFEPIRTDGSFAVGDLVMFRSGKVRDVIELQGRTGVIENTSYNETHPILVRLHHPIDNVGSVVTTPDKLALLAAAGSLEPETIKKESAQ